MKAKDVPREISQKLVMLICCVDQLKSAWFESDFFGKLCFINRYTVDNGSFFQQHLTKKLLMEKPPSFDIQFAFVLLYTVLLYRWA